MIFCGQDYCLSENLQTNLIVPVAKFAKFLGVALALKYLLDHYFSLIAA